MARRAQFTDDMILEAAKQLKADGKQISPWTVRVAVGGGKVSRIERILSENELTILDAEPAKIEHVLTLPSQFVPHVEQIQQSIHIAACEMWRISTEMADNRVRDEFAAAKAAKEKAELELSEARAAVDRLEDEMELIESESEVLKDGKRQLLLERQNAQQAILSLEADKKSQAEQLSELRNTVENLKQDIEKERSRASEMQGECRAKNSQLEALASEKKQLEQNHASEKQQLQQDHAKTNASINELSGRNHELTASLKKKTVEKENLKQQATDMLDESSRLHAVISGLESSVKNHTATIEKLEASNKKITEENKSLVEKTGSLQGEIKAMKTGIKNNRTGKSAVSE